MLALLQSKHFKVIYSIDYQNVENFKWTQLQFPQRLFRSYGVDKSERFTISLNLTYTERGSSKARVLLAQLYELLNQQNYYRSSPLYQQNKHLLLLQIRRIIPLMGVRILRKSIRK